MIKDGIGGGNTTTGLVFETKADLKTLLNGVKNYSVDKDNNVLYKGKLVGMIFVKNGLYKFLEKMVLIGKIIFLKNYFLTTQFM